MQQHNNARIGIIGGGNMGSCLIGGLIQHGYTADKITVSDSHPEKRDVLAQQWGINILTDNKTLISTVDILVLAVKPQSMRAVITEIQPAFNPKQTLCISIAAGITTMQIQNWLQADSAPIIRAMPNTPALLGYGITGLFANEHVSALQKNTTETILRALGEIVWIEKESLMDVVTALSGSGPAYFFYIMEILQHSAESLGLSPEEARKLTFHTVLGSAQMALHSQDDIQTLRKKVTSPGGTTEAGIKVLQSGKLDALLRDTLEAATQQGQSLSKQFD